MASALPPRLRMATAMASAAPWAGPQDFVSTTRMSRSGRDWRACIAEPAVPLRSEVMVVQTTAPPSLPSRSKTSANTPGDGWEVRGWGPPARIRR